jgi:hypothetical protein
MTNTTLPERGVVFWPVGTGDSTTIVVDDRLVVQVDLRDMKGADDDDAVVSPVIDRLVDTLPRIESDTPYLAVFALTHADLDHCCGFGDLLDSDILIGELWATPRLWREFAEDDRELCPDAERFHQEAKRRVAATLKACGANQEPASGDRIRIIGYDDERTDHPYADLPKEYFTYPGQAITTIDGEDVSDRFEAFVHAPFRDDCAGERNETSLAMQVTLRDEDTETHLLLFGDLSYITLTKIFDYSEANGRDTRVAWDVMLAAHHCSKQVMYAPDDAGNEELKRDLLDQFERHAGEDAYIVASALPFRDADKPGDNPPHLVARDRYDEIISNEVLCTGEYPSVEDPHPIVFGLEPGRGFVLLDVEDLEEAERRAGGTKSGRLIAALGATALAAGTAWAARQSQKRGTDAVREAVEQTRGTDAAPAAPVGFGQT